MLVPAGIQWLATEGKQMQVSLFVKDVPYPSPSWMQGGQAGTLLVAPLLSLADELKRPRTGRGYLSAMSTGDIGGERTLQVAVGDSN